MQDDEDMSCYRRVNMRTFLVVLAEGAWGDSVSTFHDGEEERDGNAPCLEDVGVDELGLRERHNCLAATRALWCCLRAVAAKIRFGGLPGAC